VTTNESAGQEVVVFRDDRETFILRKSPNPLVVYSYEPHISHMATPGKAGQENVDEAKR
jgi:hypothetical protein